ncbi:MAG: TIGR02646 family protein [Prolixibacteraceae bacterium]|nr:TIGR02646 family protein [Prolixibacteraceae bacterium]
MIQITRIDKPEILISKEEKWKSTLEIALSEFLLNKSTSKRKKLDLAYSKYKHKQIKDSLRRMFSDKCAYCESHISHIGFGHIEHFHPKSKFPDLCYDWDNLMLSCEICNGKEYKGDKFPESYESGPLINPVEENPDDFFYFEYDPYVGVANVIPKNNNKRAITTEEVLGLNRSELVKHRSYIVTIMAFAALKAKQGDEEGKEIIKKCCGNENEYAAFARALVKRFKIE